MTVADDHKSVVMKSVRNNVFIQVVAQITVEPGPDVFVDRLEFYENKRKPVYETNQIGPSIVIGRSAARDLEFANCNKTVVVLTVGASAVLEVNYARLRMAQ